VSGHYSTSRWRKLRASFRRDCELRRLRCGRCRQAIDYSLDYPDPGSFQADHIQPGSTHPHLFYRRDNLQPIHKRCNEARQADAIDHTWTAPQW
jgi:5-methylcytosine-specific restriction endonuclease McrA